MRKTLYFLFIGFVSFVASGCSSEKLPDGMPDLIPTVIKLTQGGAPLEGASIALVPQTAENSRWASGGSTDSNGEVTIQTLGRYPGAPPGKYKVTVYKSLVEDLSPGLEDSPNVSKKYKTFSLVDTKLRTPDTTSLQLEVAGPETLQTFDVGRLFDWKRRTCEFVN